MNFKALVFLPMFLLLSFFASAEETAKTNSTKLQGTWTIKSILRDPREKTDEARGLGFKVSVTNDSIFVTAPEIGPIGPLLFRADTNAVPATLDIWVDESAFGKSKQQILSEDPVLAIYEIKGDTLKVCWARLEDRNRPHEFASPPGSERTLITLQRTSQ